jgi:hypothetical protein
VVLMCPIATTALVQNAHSMHARIHTRSTTECYRTERRPISGYALVHRSDSDLNQRGQFGRQGSGPSAISSEFESHQGVRHRGNIASGYDLVEHLIEPTPNGIQQR